METPRILEVEPYRVPPPNLASPRRRHARVAEPHAHAQQWQPENIVQRAERGCQRYLQIGQHLRIVGPYLVRREKVDCYRLVAPCEHPAAAVLPVGAKPRAMLVP